jgi:hypothetical protein
VPRRESFSCRDGRSSTCDGRQPAGCMCQMQTCMPAVGGLFSFRHSCPSGPVGTVYGLMYGFDHSAARPCMKEDWLDVISPGDELT